MGGLPDPLDRYRLGYRLLMDGGIKDAMRQGLISFEPSIDADSPRIQPMSVDRRIAEIVEADPLEYELKWREHAGPDVLPANSRVSVRLEDRLSFPHQAAIGPITEGRSSLRRLGPSSAHGGGMYFSGPEGDETEILTSCNPIRNITADYSLQTIFRVFPFFDDPYYDPLHPQFAMPEYRHNIELHELAERVRALDMAVQTSSHDDLSLLMRKGHLEVGPQLTSRYGTLVVHASDTAYRFRELPDGIDFARRSEYKPEDLLEPITLRGGYTVRPGEHIIIETKERFRLSPHVGIIFQDSSIALPLPSKERSNMSTMMAGLQNSVFLDLLDGLMDPGYSGGFSRQPKTLTGRTIYPGDKIGAGLVFFSPQGSTRVYGDEALKSQYQNKRRIAFAA